MKKIKNLAAIAATMLVLAACKKDAKPSLAPVDVDEDVASSASGNKKQDQNSGSGRVFTLSNQTSGNRVLDYHRSANGHLSLAGSHSNGGNGSGGGLGNQGAVILTEDGGTLLAVNPGSNSISSLKITGNGLNLKSTVPSGGTMPVSIAQHGDLVFVLNAGGSGNISGFKLGHNNKLERIPHSTRPLSSASAGAAQISFVRNGRVLVITEKATNKIITYTVNEYGIPGAMHSITAANTTPFGFAPGRFGNIYVSEAAGGAAGASTVSSYHIGFNGSISLADGPVGANQSAACWVVLTANGLHAYSTNTASDNLSSFRVNPFTGNLNLLHSIAATTDAGPIDAALSSQSKFLYILNSVSNTIGAYRVALNGNLSTVQTIPGLPVGANGLAAK